MNAARRVMTAPKISSKNKNFKATSRDLEIEKVDHFCEKKNDTEKTTLDDHAIFGAPDLLEVMLWLCQSVHPILAEVVAKNLVKM